LQDVPHGIVSYRYYNSKTLNVIRTLVIYTPPGYEANNRKKYPVLYLIHGMTDTEETWFKVGKANLILDNLISHGKAEPMIIVMPYANTYSAIDPSKNKRGDALVTHVFDREMKEDIIPFIEKNYRVITDKEHRAVAGFSLGGRQTMAIGLSNPEMFDFVCLYAPAIWENEFNMFFNDVFADPVSINQLKLLSLSCGQDDRLYNSTLEFNKVLDKKNINYRTFFTTGGHTWMNCKLFLTESVQLLFR